VTEEQIKKLKRRKRNEGADQAQKEAQRWADMYKILFPDENNIPSACESRAPNSIAVTDAKQRNLLDHEYPAYGIRGQPSVQGVDPDSYQDFLSGSYHHNFAMNWNRCLPRI
jgi:hypothetical protein